MEESQNCRVTIPKFMAIFARREINKEWRSQLFGIGKGVWLAIS